MLRTTFCEPILWMYMNDNKVTWLDLVSVFSLFCILWDFRGMFQLHGIVSSSHYLANVPLSLFDTSCIRSRSSYICIPGQAHHTWEFCSHKMQFSQIQMSFPPWNVVAGEVYVFNKVWVQEVSWSSGEFPTWRWNDCPHKKIKNKNPGSLHSWALRLDWKSSLEYSLKTFLFRDSSSEFDVVFRCSLEPLEYLGKGPHLWKCYYHQYVSGTLHVRDLLFLAQKLTIVPFQQWLQFIETVVSFWG